MDHTILHTGLSKNSNKCTPWISVFSGRSWWTLWYANVSLTHSLGWQQWNDYVTLPLSSSVSSHTNPRYISLIHPHTRPKSYASKSSNLVSYSLKGDLWQSHCRSPACWSWPQMTDFHLDCYWFFRRWSCRWLGWVPYWPHIRSLSTTSQSLSGRMRRDSSYNPTWMGPFLPCVGEDTGTNQLVNFLLIGISIVDGVTVPFLVRPEAIMRPKGIIIIKVFLLSFTVDESGGLAIHLHAQTGV